MGSITSLDILSEGFGASSGAFPAPATNIGRLIRTIRASRSRVAITGIDVGFFSQGQAVSTTRVYNVCVTVFRQSPSNPFPDLNLAFITVAKVMPAGVECLWNQNITGTVTTLATGGTYCSPLSQNSFSFYPGTISADASQILLVVVTQPILSDGAAVVAGTSMLSVTGFDYGDAAQNQILPGERSYPRF